MIRLILLSMMELFLGKRDKVVPLIYFWLKAYKSYRHDRGQGTGLCVVQDKQ